MKRKAFAKINLALDILSRRKDGYHNIDTIMVPISLYDEMECIKRKKGLIIQGMDDLNREDNYITKAWKLLCRETGQDLGLEVRIQKKIPMEAGLAGGTSDGAAILHSLNDLYRLGYSTEELAGLSLPLGADFPYMVTGGTVRARGIGEDLTPLDDFGGIFGLLVNPGFGISTPWVYQSIVPDGKRLSMDSIVKAMKEKDLLTLGNLLENKMEKVVFSYFPRVEEIQKEMEELGGISRMSGSGASVFGLFSAETDRDQALRFFKDKYEKVYPFVTGGCHGSI
ncbi:MAG: 4-(cytidine 5'-diphospho)-2-C-methyl-D-erythritol kinase [Tissierellia bacterium]|nr:4-(cytidine 5'-diphospho)-2-C-methyl-D-erythritol kinase [Tissierellia bacterium]